jgi:hypothetical protein
MQQKKWLTASRADGDVQKMRTGRKPVFLPHWLLASAALAEMLRQHWAAGLERGLKNQNGPCCNTACSQEANGRAERCQPFMSTFD